MNIKEQIEKVVSKISGDQSMLEKFQKNPAQVVESIIGVDLPDDIVNKVIDGVKAGLTMDKVSGALGAFKKLF